MSDVLINVANDIADEVEAWVHAQQGGWPVEKTAAFRKVIVDAVLKRIFATGEEQMLS